MHKGMPNSRRMVVRVGLPPLNMMGANTTTEVSVDNTTAKPT